MTAFTYKGKAVAAQQIGSTLGVRCVLEERVLDCCLVTEDQGALSEIVENESGKHHVNHASLIGKRPKWPMSA
jgi:hypothetical protein